MSLRLPVNRLASAVAIATAMQAGAVFAQETILITGKPVDPNQTTITQEQLEQYQATNLEDIFSQDPDVRVGGSFGVAQKVYVRGIEDTMLNVTVDGATQAGYLFHHQGRLSVEPELLKQVEVNAGAGLATDGPGALGGAIRFITKDPEDLLREGEDVGALVKLSYFDNTGGGKASTSIFGRLSDDVSVLTSFSKTDTGEIVDGDGNTLDNTKTEQDNAYLKLVAKLDESQTLRFSHEARYDDGRRNVRPHFVAAGWNQANEQQSRRNTTNVQYNLNTDNPLVDLQTNVYYTKSYLTQTPDSGAKDGAGVKSMGLNAHNTFDLGEHKLVVGTDLRRDTGYYINNTSTTGPSQDEVLDLVGLYVQDHYQLSDATLLTAGLRYDSYQLNDSTGQDIDSDGFSPNVGVRYSVSENLDLHASYAQAYRGVGIKEAYLLNFATYGDNVKAEEAENIEFGFDYEKDDLTFSATAFYSEIDNPLRRTSRSVITNDGKVKNKGITARVGYDWDRTRASVGYSHIRPTLNGEPLSDGTMSVGTAVGDTLSLNLEHDLPNYDLQLGWSSRLVQRLERVASGRTDKPGYGVHDAFAKWLPTGTEDLALTVTVKNLFDKQYLDHASYGVDTDDGSIIGLPEPGRDVRLTLAMRF